MTLTEAIVKATTARDTKGAPQLVIQRDDHPHVTGPYFYAIDAREKRLWTQGERVLVIVCP